MIYFSILLLLILCEYINILTNYKYKFLHNVYIVSFGIFLFFIAAFRDGIGFDYMNYKKVFDNITINNTPFSSSNIELGYYLINLLSTSFVVVVFISAILAIPLKIKVICEYSEDGLLSLLMYFTSVFIMFDMGVMRQGISIAIGLLSIRYILNRDFKRFIITILCGTLFHITIITMIPLYFIGDKKINRKIIYSLSFAALFFSFFNVTNKLLQIVGKLPLGTIAYKINYYLSTTNDNLTLSLIKRLIFLVIFVEFYNYKKVNDSKAYLFLNGYFLSVIIMGLFSGVDIIGGRGTMVLYCMQIFIFAIILKRMEMKPIKLGFFLLIILLSINTMMGPISQGKKVSQPYTPYKTIFSKSYDVYRELYL